MCIRDSDRDLADKVFAQLQAMNKEYNKTLLVVTHDPLIAQRCDRVLHIEALAR